MEALKQEAIEALSYSYSPYSGFAVGAAVQDEEGRIYRGANIENASYGLSVCAERSAVIHALSQGAKKLSAIAISTKTQNPEDALPCGACLQVLSEFLPQKAVVLLTTAQGKEKSYLLQDLLPHAFSFQKQNS